MRAVQSRRAAFRHTPGEPARVAAENVEGTSMSPSARSIEWIEAIGPGMHAPCCRVRPETVAGRRACGGAHPPGLGANT
jgi:hypothetical protein